MKKLVSIKHGYEPHRMAYDALERVFEDNVEGKRILLKPNAGRIGEPNTALCTGAEVVRGVIQFFKDQKAGEILVGDGALWGVDVWKAMEMAGIIKVCEEEGVTPVNLDEYKPIYKEIIDGVMVDRLKFSSLVFDVDMIVSIPVIKTHMYTGATLSIKNMKGCLYKMEKTLLHRLDKPNPYPEKGRVLDIGIADMSSVLLPDYSVLDGTICMEGFGPSVGTRIDLDLVVASKDPTAADYVGVQLMGMEYDAIKHINLVQERCNTAGIENIVVEPEDFMKYSKTFSTADMSKLDNMYPNIKVIEKGTCSACSAAIMTFIQRHGDKFDDFKITLATGKDLTDEDLNSENLVLVGTCAGVRGREKGISFTPGCPPVGSTILGFIEKRREESTESNL